MQNKVAWITGGSKGIGLGIAKELLKRGYKVCISGRSQESLDTAKASLKDSADLLCLASDVCDLQQCQKTVDQIVEQFGQLDVVIANAGVGHFAPIQDMTEEQFDQTMAVNLKGVFNTIKPTIAPLKESKGYIFTIASLAGTNFFARGSAYNASKFGLVGFTQAIMLDLRQFDIKVSTIMPGSVATYFNNNTPGPKDDWKIQPEDIGKLLGDLLEINPRSLPSKIEMRPSKPPAK